LRYQASIFHLLTYDLLQYFCGQLEDCCNRELLFSGLLCSGFLFCHSVLREDHVPYILPSWAWTSILTLFPYVIFFPYFYISLPCLLSFCFSPFPFLYCFQISSPFSSSPLFFVSCCFIWVPSLPFLYY